MNRYTDGHTTIRHSHTANLFGITVNISMTYISLATLHAYARSSLPQISPVHCWAINMGVSIRR